MRPDPREVVLICVGHHSNIFQHGMGKTIQKKIWLSTKSSILNVQDIDKYTALRKRYDILFRSDDAITDLGAR
jgi:hypothetical protein